MEWKKAGRNVMSLKKILSSATVIKQVKTVYSKYIFCICEVILIYERGIYVSRMIPLLRIDSRYMGVLEIGP